MANLAAGVASAGGEGKSVARIAAAACRTFDPIPLKCLGRTCARVLDNSPAAMIGQKD
jgi:hypothetical protein